jgi:hypothetical protein
VVLILNCRGFVLGLILHPVVVVESAPSVSMQGGWVYGSRSRVLGLFHLCRKLRVPKLRCIYYARHKKRDALTKIVTAKLSVNGIFKKLVRSGNSSIRQRECDLLGPFPIIRLEITGIWKWVLKTESDHIQNQNQLWAWNVWLSRWLFANFCVIQNLKNSWCLERSWKDAENELNLSLLS